MTYEKTKWVNNQTKLNADNMNKIENGIEENSKSIPNGINVDSDGKLVLEKDGVEISGQSKNVTPVVADSLTNDQYNIGHGLVVGGDTDIVGAVSTTQNISLKNSSLKIYGEDGTLAATLSFNIASAGPYGYIKMGDEESGHNVEYEFNGFPDWNKSGAQIINLRQIEYISLTKGSTVTSSGSSNSPAIYLTIQQNAYDLPTPTTRYVFSQVNTDNSGIKEIDLYSEIQSLDSKISSIAATKVVKCDDTFSSWIGQGTIDMGSPSTWVRNIVDDTSNLILFVYDGTGENVWITSKATKSSSTVKGLYMHGGILYEMTLTYTTVELKALTNAQ